MPFDLTVPIQRSDETTFQLVWDLRIAVRHKLRCLLLTIPGERVMYPQYGVGIKRFLFENDVNFPMAQLKNVVTNQVQRYMNFLEINDLSLRSDPQFPNKVTIVMRYSVPSLNVSDLLVLTI
jgi:phage baseplate assembly protein W